MSDRSRSNWSPTVAEVAAEAGVGKATAARTLGNYGSVSPSSRARVLAAAEKLRYRPNGLARSMTTGITQTIGVILADISNPFFAGVMRGIADTCEAIDYTAIALSTDERLPAERSAMDVLIDKQVDGIIIASAAVRADDVSHIQDALDRGIPVVLLDRTIRGISLDSVIIDNRESARRAVEHLIAKGHRRIAFTWGPRSDTRLDSIKDLLDLNELSLWSDAERFRGYIEALERAGIEPVTELVTHGLRSVADTAQDVGKMLQLDDPPTAVLATETEAMVGTLRALRQNKLSYPRDVSLIGFDDSPWADVMDPPLSMIAQPMAQLGRDATERVLRRIEGLDEAPVVDTLPTQFIERGSVSDISQRTQRSP
jgi:LacI family transcriptional regulator